MTFDTALLRTLLTTAREKKDRKVLARASGMLNSTEFERLPEDVQVHLCMEYSEADIAVREAFAS